MMSQDASADHSPLFYLKLASFKENKRPNRCNAASHGGAAVLAHVALIGRWPLLLDERSKIQLDIKAELTRNFFKSFP